MTLEGRDATLKLRLYRVNSTFAQCVGRYNRRCPVNSCCLMTFLLDLITDCKNLIMSGEASAALSDVICRVKRRELADRRTHSTSLPTGELTLTSSCLQTSGRRQKTQRVGELDSPAASDH